MSGGLETLLEAINVLENGQNYQQKSPEFYKSTDEDKSIILSELRKEESKSEVKRLHRNGSYYRERSNLIHNKLEKDRRAHLKTCFERLKYELPPHTELKRMSNLAILKTGHKFIQSLNSKSKHLDAEVARLSQQKNELERRLSSLRTELETKGICDVDFVLAHVRHQQQQEPNSFDDKSTSTASEGNELDSETEDANSELDREVRSSLDTQGSVKRSSESLAESGEQTVISLQHRVPSPSTKSDVLEPGAVETTVNRPEAIKEGRSHAAVIQPRMNSASADPSRVILPRNPVPPQTLPVSTPSFSVLLPLNLITESNVKLAAAPPGGASESIHDQVLVVPANGVQTGAPILYNNQPVLVPLVSAPAVILKPVIMMVPAGGSAHMLLNSNSRNRSRPSPYS